MIYLLHGTNTHKAREKLNALLKTLFARKPDAALIRMDAEHFTGNELETLAGTQGLFEKKSIIVLDALCSDATHKEVVLKNLPELEASENVFILLEESLDSKTRAKIDKHAEKVQEFSSKGDRGRRDSFNIFGLSDALGERDKKKIWILYQIGKLDNISPEEMHGILFWGVKNMLLAKHASVAKETGLSPFVYKKALASAKRYSEEELRALSRDLTLLYHGARRGEVSFDIGFEQFILNLHTA